MQYVAKCQTELRFVLRAIMVCLMQMELFGPLSCHSLSIIVCHALTSSTTIDVCLFPRFLENGGKSGGLHHRAGW